MVALNNCPFCAGEATLDGKSDYVRVRCLKCGTQGQAIYFDRNEDEDYSVEELQAAEAWNRRTSQQVPEGRVIAPTSATQEMIKAAEQVDDLYRMGQPQLWGRVYRAMIAAAPAGGETGEG